MNFEKWWKDKHPEICGTPEISKRDFELMREVFETSKAAEREACAGICDAMASSDSKPTDRIIGYMDCAEAIRERSNV